MLLFQYNYLNNTDLFPIYTINNYFYFNLIEMKNNVRKMNADRKLREFLKKKLYNNLNLFI